jgi:hypothetical protein
LRVEDMRRTQPTGRSEEDDVLNLNFEELRVRLCQEAQLVMEESLPTPTQAEVDGIVKGLITYDDKVDPNNPEMPPIHTQKALMDLALEAEIAGPDPTVRVKRAS